LITSSTPMMTTSVQCRTNSDGTRAASIIHGMGAQKYQANSSSGRRRFSAISLGSSRRSRSPAYATLNPCAKVCNRAVSSGNDAVARSRAAHRITTRTAEPVVSTVHFSSLGRPPRPARADRVPGTLPSGTNHHDRAGGVLDAALADRTQQRADEAAVPVAADHEQIRVLGLIDKHRCRVAGSTRRCTGTPGYAADTSSTAAANDCSATPARSSPSTTVGPTP